MSGDRTFRVNLYIDPEADPEIFELLRGVHPRRRAERLRHAILAGLAQPFQRQPTAITETAGAPTVAAAGPAAGGAEIGHAPGGPAPATLSPADASLVAEELGHIWD